MPVPEDRRPTTFRLLIVPGVTVDKWGRRWSERLPEVDLELVPAEAAEAAMLLSDRAGTGGADTGRADTGRTDTGRTDTGRADAGLVRLPIDQNAFHAIPLYTEATVVVVPKDHLLAAADEVTLTDLADETLLRPLDDVLDWTGVSDAPPAVAADRPATTAAAVEWVAAEVGVLVVPQSLARAHHRRDVTYRVVTDAPTSSIALAWARDRYTDLVEEMIGIVRGRTANSTRGRAQTPAASAEPSGRTGSRRGGTNQRTSPRRRKR